MCHKEWQKREDLRYQIYRQVKEYHAKAMREKKEELLC